ncbi:MAG: polyamine aminopropyltransferase [Deltaproteobacteria bacterium]|nr:polyamine aminopropyltransferase [Deltaproteobacteria bacterium]
MSNPLDTTPVDASPADSTDSSAGSVPSRAGSAPLLLLSIFVIATCGLIYELLAASLSSYLMGNSVAQFSLVIGLFLSAMGIGSFLSRYVTSNLIRTFIVVEIWVGLIGGALPMLLFSSFALLGIFMPLLVGLSLVVGTLVGLEIPLLVRILRAEFSLKAALGNVLSVDYLGALAASLLFPMVLVPKLGMVRTGFLFGLFNVAVALMGMHVFRHQLPGLLRLRSLAAVTGIILTAGLLTAGKTTRLLEDVLYDDTIIYTKTTPFQRLVVTRWRNDIRLFINGNIQFSTVDEFRYHEALVHPVMGMVPNARKVLVLGGGDGLGIREIVKHPQVKMIHLVDLDPEMTRIFSTIGPLKQINENALADKRVKIFNADAQKFLETSDEHYDVVIIDLPDPNNTSLGKLYSRSFYRLVAKHLSPTGAMVTQATSPFYATAAFWCITNTIAAADIASGGPTLRVLPYRASVPSFGEWGFVMASLQPLDPARIRLPKKTRYLTQALLPSLFVFPKDIGPRKTPINRLDNQILIRLYEKGYRRYNYGK